MSTPEARPLRIGVAGAAGRMGEALTRAVLADPNASLSAASVREGSAMAGEPARGAPPTEGVAPVLTDDPAALGESDVVVDFTAPDASVALAERLAPQGVKLVIGTTGFSAAQESAITEAARTTGIVKSGNMSLGVNLLSALVRRAAASLPAADIEIVEMHHRRKVDAPSGTALMLGHSAALGRDIALEDHAVYARHGATGARPDGAIGFQSLRGGTVTGEHGVIFAMNAERLVLSHVAEDRAIFAEGAVAAAHWLADKPAGLYSMADVLGLADF